MHTVHVQYEGMHICALYVTAGENFAICIYFGEFVKRGHLRADQSEVQSIQIESSLQWLSCLI